MPVFNMTGGGSGKKYATGTAAASSGVMTISGLGFLPKSVILGIAMNRVDTQDAVRTHYIVSCAFGEVGTFHSVSSMSSGTVSPTVEFSEGSVVITAAIGSYTARFLGTYTWVAME